MTNATNKFDEIGSRLLTTEDFALALSLKPQSLRKRFSQTGSYFGIKPYKLPNGKLRWSSDSLSKILASLEECNE